jgi:NAD(P)-dependent dehydrogenase (short-subunit alcohol dehydrogenase family)
MRRVGRRADRGGGVRVERDLGNPDVVIHNAVGGAIGTFLEIDPAILNRNFQVNTMGLLYLARRFAPAMVSSPKGRDHRYRQHLGVAGQT